MNYRKIRRLLLYILPGIMVISNIYLPINNCYAASKVTSELVERISPLNSITGKVTASSTAYASSVVVAPGIPTNLKAISSSYNSTYINWGAATGASGYEVYRATSTVGPYALIGTLSGTSYTNTGLVTGTTYYYKVKAYTMVGTVKAYSSFSTVVSAKVLPSIPTNVKTVASSYNSINATWGAVSGASGYEIYRATSGTGSYSLLTTINSTSYTNTGLLTGSTWYYKVRAFTMVGTTKIYGSFSTIVNAKAIPSAPSGVTAVSSSYNSIKTTWKAVAGASGYELYRATSSVGVYSLVTNANGTSYTDTGLITGATFYYKVRPYTLVGTTRVYGNYSVVVTGVPIPSTPISINASVSSYNSIKATWSAVAGANAYEVYRATSSTGTYSLITTTTGTSYINTGVTKGVTYYYKVRAYRNVGTKKVYSNYSSNCIVTASNKGYVNNPEYIENPKTQRDLNVRLAPNINGAIMGYLYNFQRIEILDSVVGTDNIVWDKIIYNGKVGYVSNAYIQLYTSPADTPVSIAKNITKQFEFGTQNQIAGNFDGQGMSLGYLQWCVGQRTLQPLLNRMDRQYKSELQDIFGTNYNTLQNIILDTPENQLKWAKSINDTSNKIKAPWYSQFVKLTNSPNFIKIEQDAEVYSISQAMRICDKYKLRTVRGFALAFDIVVQNGSISSAAAKTIDSAIIQTPNMTEKALLAVIAKAVADNSGSSAGDVRERKMAIVNGQGAVHGSTVYLDKTYGLSDNYWR